MNEGRPGGRSTLIGAIHQHRHTGEWSFPALKQGPPLRCIMRLTAGKAECQGCSSIRGNQMNLGIPSSARFPDGLRPLFLGAPVPSG